MSYYKKKLYLKNNINIIAIALSTGILSYYSKKKPELKTKAILLLNLLLFCC